MQTDGTDRDVLRGRAGVGGIGTARAWPGARTLRAFDGHGFPAPVSGPGDPGTGGA
ncbi:hypothetical protein [Streptomyces canus]|uniref:hypothetical protein n=1 Tax=Streptomyces canus TaxID=58343 RepID=UPI002E3129F3|nr:hypothetical protein [Streptomyces canus]